MKLKLAVAVLLLSALSASAEQARFDNYRVYSVDVATHDQLTVLRELSETSDSYDFWDPPALNSKVEVLVSPHKFAHFDEIMERFAFDTELVHNNWQEVIDQSNVEEPTGAADAMSWTAYHSVETIHAWIESLKAEFPGWITVEDIGTSYQGRPLKLVKLSKNPSRNNRVVMIEANIHAREWIASATSTFVLNELLRSTDPEVVNLANNVDWYILPQANPDGYEYTRSTNRNWRKTRSPASLTCVGTDPNRNFAYNWLVPDEGGDLGASRSPCSDTYAGPNPFSDPETIAVENFLIKNRDRIDVYISFHAYAHMLLYPMGHTRQTVANHNELVGVANAAIAKLYAKHGIQYRAGNPIALLYAASGTSPDHAYGAHGIKISYTYEMRGNGVYGNHGFALPPQFIIPNGEEVMQSLIGLVSQAQVYGYLK